MKKGQCAVGHISLTMCYFNLTLPMHEVLFLRLSFMLRGQGFVLSLMNRAFAGAKSGLLPKQFPHDARLLVSG